MEIRSERQDAQPQVVPRTDLAPEGAGVAQLNWSVSPASTKLYEGVTVTVTGSRVVITIASPLVNALSVIVALTSST